MSDVSDEARSLFDAGRTGHEPSEDDRERVLRGVLVRTGVVATTVAAHSASASAAAGAGTTVVGVASSSGLAALGLKLVLGLAIAGSAGAGIYHFSRGHSALPSASVAVAGSPPVSRGDTSAPPAGRAMPENQEPTDRPEGVAAPTKRSPGANGKDVAKSSLAAESQAPTSPRGPAAADAVVAQAPATAAFPDQAPASVSQAKSASTKSGDAGSALSDEARALADVQRALREGRNTEALTMVEQQQQRFPGGELGQERQAAKIVALCAVGRVAEARSLAARFLAESPRSPLAARIRSTCASP